MSAKRSWDIPPATLEDTAVRFGEEIRKGQPALPKDAIYKMLSTAAKTPGGVVVETSDAYHLRKMLYQLRRLNPRFHEFKNQLLVCPRDKPHELWIINRDEK